MKKCTYCGKEFPDVATSCDIDGQALVHFNPPPIELERPPVRGDVSFTLQLVTLLTKLVLYFAAWGILAFIVWRENPDQLKEAPGFPMGLLGVLPEKSAIVVAMFGGPLVLIGGWALYGLVTWYILRIRTLLAYLIALLLFCILLALNMAGCNKMIGIASGIH
jgi:hypothetical protein